MATTTEQPERSVPKITFTDAEAGAQDFPSSTSRSYNYYEPAKRRASIYEDVTVDVQPDPSRHLTQGWVYGFADGPGGYPAEWTELRSSDWHAFRDPNGEWEQTIYRNNASIVRQIGANLDAARSEGAFERWSAGWTRVIAEHVGAWMHVEQGLGMHVFVPAQRDAPSNMINNAICVNSVHKLRFAQDLALYNLAVSEARTDFDGKAHLQTWAEDPAWQGVRENAEGLTGIRDWAKAVFCTSMVFEPLVGELFRSHFVMQVAAPNGDFVTPTLMGVGENDFDRDLAYTTALFGGLADDPEHGKHNRETMAGWLAEWVPRSVQAARRLQPVWSQANAKVVRFEDALDRVRVRTREIAETLEVETPKELQG